MPATSYRTSQLPAPLQAAYRSALYQIDSQTKTGVVAQTLRVGQRNDWLAQQLSQLPVPAACYLTSCNPRGQVLSAAQNTSRMRVLRQALRLEDWQYLNGCGQDPAGQWPGEDSVLIWAMDVDTAVQWAEQCEQNAVLWIGADAIPQLLWLR